MEIFANTEIGRETIVHDKEGNKVNLPIQSINTTTLEAVIYELDDFGKVKTTPWTPDPDNPSKMNREMITKTITLPVGSYVTVKGQRVED